MGFSKSGFFFSHKLIWKFHFFNIKFWGLECERFENGIFPKPYFTLKFFLTYEIFLTLWTLFSSFLLHYLSVRLEFFTSLLSLDLQRNFFTWLTVKTLNLPTNLAKYSSKRLKIALFFFWARAPGPGLFNLKFCVD